MRTAEPQPPQASTPAPVQAETPVQTETPIQAETPTVPQPLAPTPVGRPSPRRPTRQGPKIAARPKVTSPAPDSSPASDPHAAPAAAPPAAEGWNTLFVAWLASHKTYPEAARHRGDEGNITLRVRIRGDGQVQEVVLLGSSGSTVLDDAAQLLLRGAKLPEPRIELTRFIRLRYRLED
ncbi:MAG TPA: TonB family protein [Rhodopila sp.]|nr:TonB family protein [Rhodopila sp.]